MNKPVQNLISLIGIFTKEKQTPPGPFSCYESIPLHNTLTAARKIESNLIAVSSNGVTRMICLINHVLPVADH